LREEDRFRIRFVIAQQIAQGMRFLHSRRVVHRDLKPDNVLFDATLAVKLCDFGMSRLQSAQTNLMTGEVGTPAYMAVELARGETVK
jgi:serine/threonine-protein kinase